MPDSVRVRYAPSPTGIPHVGNIRAALFNWLFARGHDGAFIVRIEDTDQGRLVPGAVEAILESLEWLGLDWDEGPTRTGAEKGRYASYFQSKRRAFYVDFSNLLLETGHAYRCYCTPRRLEEMRLDQQRRKLPPKYDLLCRDLTPQARAEQERSGAPKVIRFATPLEDSTTFNDLIRGDITFENAVLDDFVILKSDGYPTYHLANVVDDHLMEITHVVRGDEWVSSTPKHMLLYQAFGWTPPLFAHLPLILGPDRSKLSKRHGATSLLEYRDGGYLPEAMLNFLALLGWSLDDRTEIIGRNELASNFSIERIGKTGAIFNIEKLQWMNGVYIRALTPADVTKRLLPFLEKDLSPEVSRPLSKDYLTRVVPLIQERLKVLTEGKELTEFFFLDKLRYDPALLIQKGMEREGALRILRAALERMPAPRTFDAASLEAIFRPLAERMELKTSQLFGTLRVAVTGSTVAPPLFETMAVLGRDRCTPRISDAIAALTKD